MPYLKGKEFWFPCSEVLKMPSGPGMLNWLMKKSLEGEDLQLAYKVLDRLYQVVHKDPVVYYYEEASSKLERVLQIFIRLNSAGTLLSQSDILHSIAVAQWSHRDARREISALVDDLNRSGAWYGTFTQSFVLKAGLMLADVGSVGFKVENFTRKNMGLLENKWDQIRAALLMTASLAHDFGLNSQTIRAHSSLLPIAYYLLKVGTPSSFLTHTKYAEDRKTIKGWLLASLLKASGIWGSGLDTLLTALRDVIARASGERFPADDLRSAMLQRGKSLAFSDPELDGLVDLQYHERGTFLLLSLLYPFVDLRNKFHIDHVFPSALLTASALKRDGVPDERIPWITLRRNNLANLQLLEGAENNEKRRKLPAEWVALRYSDAAELRHYLDLFDMGPDLPAKVDGFPNFYVARRSRLRARIESVLND